jgi:VWFA-related protein
MRRLIPLLLVMATVLPAGAARRVTVAQLEQALAADQVSHRADAEIAHQLGDFELSERLTNSTLNRFAARLPLGPRTALALQLLSDQSAFLDPPASELPATALPDDASQQRMMDAARGYVVQTWSRLPNFFVTRVTNRFDDSPQVLVRGDWPVRAGMHVVGTASREVTFRDGLEVQDSTPAAVAASNPAKPALEVGLRTWGEFGPALSVVLTDVVKGTINFSHWEQTSAGIAAVYKYSVPKSASHYSVHYCCLRQDDYAQRREMGYGGSGRGRGGSNLQPNLPRNDVSQAFTETPGYHGSLSVDPATGAVVRITIEAELKTGDPLIRASTMVEYGPVAIGDRSFICPVRSLALSMEDPGTGGVQVLSSATTDSTAWGGSAARPDHTPIMLVNETSFTHYHRLGATMRMLADGEAPETPAPKSDVPPGNGDTVATVAPPHATASPAPPDPQTASNAPPEPLPPTPPPADPVVPEISMGPATGLPDAPANAPPSQEGGYSLKVTSRLVDVGVVAWDKKGRPVKDLNQTDFEIYDNGQKQEIRFFGEVPSAIAPSTPATPPGLSPATPEESRSEIGFTNRTVTDATPATPSPENGATILLIDESHIAWSDMNNARTQMIKFLGALPAGERVGLYTMTGLGFRVMAEVTTDHAALIARMKAFLPTAQSVSQAQEEETRNRQQFNEVHNVADLNSVNGNHNDVPDAEQPIDPQLLSMGSNPARASLILLAQVARHISALSGHKSLVWVSSDNVFAEWENQAVGIDKSPKSIDSYALRAQEAMNDAHAAVYPFDVSQLEGAAITADMQHRNVELTQAAADNAATAAAAGGPSQPSAAGRNMSPGRITAEMSQDLHPVQGTIRQVAAATGGRVIRRSGDLAKELEEVVEDGHATYMLSFSPAGQADGQYHNITVRLTGRRGLTLRYRTGYIFQKEPSTLKERFQQAVWRPMDVNEIAVAAKVLPTNAGANIKITIAAGDLGMQQQAGRWMDKLDIFFIQRDDAGLHAQVEGRTLGLRLKPSTYQTLVTSGVPFEHSVQMRPGMASLRVLVVDENSGRMGSITIPDLDLKSGN